ncbi:M73 family metallopeptidase [Curtobacterium aurantiacum]|uniref:M73 family metallopeptidase n=1 Tax=Curtobacterium aurantiacum TaxID=3236919 RepID=A0ABS5VJD0_9MICO|nr:M73 family metallopeptidase [Curtobacterium flaccumfaciens]MBT1546480.1 M73 family metallopeptidase [Curtobacterium flaccumfaciens pv. flaccumfaciens]MBT1589227.1 M73 family metallopeptidase [Curtobacterium flaccumfaciens pv. flaccumfaciens]MBT1675271.1 M73 family metallopeptidase [Curtobacterium flaccumfaciens pv. flaccumfaciens]MBT1678888.1 M73 family metallopeptidase [Curtobacterium flaccumfaciens pv. flaccumfaciens]
MSRVTPRAARLAAWIAIPAALVASGVVVSTASYAAFSSTTVNPTNNWTAGSVALSDDDNNTALFTANNLKPGSTGANCITVTSTGSLPSTVKLYGTNASTTKDLAGNMTMTVEQGTGGGFGSCSGFTPAATGGTLYSGTLAAFGTASTNYATGVGTWAPTGTASESRVYRVTYTVSSTAPNTVQGGTAALGLTWEAQNS